MWEGARILKYPTVPLDRRPFQRSPLVESGRKMRARLLNDPVVSTILIDVEQESIIKNLPLIRLHNTKKV